MGLEPTDRARLVLQLSRHELLEHFGGNSSGQG
jgi:hypothetical protein